ncbi:MAG TPA: hypothetical protein VH762_12560 [Gemmatimonadaceae bacterium]
MADVGAAAIPLSREAHGQSAEAVWLKHSFYRHLIGSARFFAQRARAAEDRATKHTEVGAAATGDLVRHRSYVSGAILSAAAFLEASVNELYLELNGLKSSERTRLPRRVLAVLGRFWSDIERAPVLHRYQVVLMVADAERFDERRAPFQDADSLMKLRDALVHFRPERPESRRRLRTLEQRLRTRFEPNPLALADSDWFPDLCLSAACAEWAVQAADAFTEDFCKRMALPARGLAWCDVTTRQPRARDRDFERPMASSKHAKGDAPDYESYSDSGR